MVITTNTIVFYVIFTIVVLIVLRTFVKCVTNSESFENPVQTVVARDTYDNFYAPVYTMLISDQIESRTKFEAADLIEKTDIEGYSKAKLLDIGCGGGDHLKWLANEDLPNLELIGMDSSESMLNETKKRIGKQDRPVRLVLKDVNEDDIFMRSSFSHITCYYFTLYYINSKAVLGKIHKWLRPNGWFVVHMVNLDKFDPVLDAAVPLSGINIQKYFKNRVTESSVEFKKFTYKSNFRLSKNKAYFDEAFEFKEKPIVRKQKHTLQRLNMDDFINMMGRQKMELKHTTNLQTFGYHDQYILYFQKS